MYISDNFQVTSYSSEVPTYRYNFCNKNQKGRRTINLYFKDNNIIYTKRRLSGDDE